MIYVANADRYEQTSYRRCGRSGIDLPPLSLGLWQNFGDETPIETQPAMLRRAFDLGVTHFDLADNYGPPYGTAETSSGRIRSKNEVLQVERLVSRRAHRMPVPARCRYPG